jgi:hypothetical protein
MRVTKGQAAAKASGRQLGWPKGAEKSNLDNHLAEITELLKTIEWSEPN